jgi:hydrogenase maturation protease
MPQVLIIAYGNPLRCDDGLAWHAADLLQELTSSSAVEIITCHQLTPELALSVSQAATVLFIDAARNGVAGELISARIEPERFSSLFSHEFSPPAILEAAQELYGKSPQAFAISLVGECFDHGETLSPKVRVSLPKLIALVTERVNKVES